MGDAVMPVESAHVLMFARAVGHPDAQVDAVPLTFVAAVRHFDPDDPLRPHDGKPWPRPSGVGRLHAEQHYEYHRPLRAGDVLTATTFPGKTWEKEGKRSGKLVFSESVTEYRDEKGELVVTARGVGVRTERPVEQPAKA